MNTTEQQTFDVIDRAVQKANVLLKAIEQQYSWENRRHQAYQALRVVLHTLRDRLPMEVAVKFGAQLSTFIRGMYYEGLDPSMLPIKINREEFVAHVASQFMFAVENADYEDLIRTVLLEVTLHMDPAETEKIKNTLPADVKVFFEAK